MTLHKPNREIVYGIISFTGLLALIYVVITFGSAAVPASDKFDRTKCPHAVEANPNASLVIKYVDSPYCVWCWLQEPILDRLVAEKGSSLRLERYDIRYCEEVVSKYRFSGTPSFVFSTGEREFTHSGYIGEVKFFRIICELTGDCHMEGQS